LTTSDPVASLQRSAIQGRSRRAPTKEEADKAGITVVHTHFQHNDMRDTGPDDAKGAIPSLLDKFLADAESDID